MTGTLARTQLIAEEASLEKRLAATGVTLWPLDALQAYRYSERMKTAGMLYRWFGEKTGFLGAGFAFVSCLSSIIVLSTTGPLVSGWPFISRVLAALVVVATTSIAGWLMDRLCRRPLFWITVKAKQDYYQVDAVDGFDLRPIPFKGVTLMKKVRSVWPEAEFQVEYLGLDPILTACGPRRLERRPVHAIFVWDRHGNEVLPPT